MTIINQLKMFHVIIYFYFSTSFTYRTSFKIRPSERHSITNTFKAFKNDEITKL